MVNYRLENHTVELPKATPLRLSGRAKDSARHFGRILVENALASERRSDPASSTLPDAFFKVIDPQTGRFKDRQEQRDADRIREKHGFTGMLFPTMPTSHVKLLEVLKEEYPKFLKTNDLEDHPDNYGLFMLGVMHHLSDEVSSLTRDNRHLGTAYVPTISRAVQSHAISPFSYGDHVSPYSAEGAPEPTQRHRDSSPHAFLNALNKASPWIALISLDPSLHSDPVQNKFDGYKLAVALKKMATDYGLNP